MISILQNFVRGQVRLCTKLDGLLPLEYQIDGNRDFRENVAPQFLSDVAVIYDVGGGKTPFLTNDQKNAMGVFVVGVDMDEDELEAAPKGAYDKTVCSAIEEIEGLGDADLVICRSVLEHVYDNERTFKAVSSMLKPGGVMLLFVPNRNAVFARLNLLLPEALKRSILFAIFPDKRENQGFPAYYDKCTPNDFTRLANAHSLSVVDTRLYYKSSYFSFFSPLYAVWRIWILLATKLNQQRFCETYAMALRKQKLIRKRQPDPVA